MARPPSQGPLPAGAQNAIKKNVMDPKKQQSIKLILIGIPIMVVSSYMLYKRLVLGEEKRRQVGEMTPDGQLRFFNQQELIEKERETWFTTIFGTESWTNSVRRR